MSEVPLNAGMVDDLSGQGGGPTEDALAFARAYLADGEMDAGLLARLSDPERAAEREAQKIAGLRRDWAGLNYYRDANAAVAGQPVEAVFIGDSITEMWQVAEPSLFGGRFQNRGISGQTSPQILLRFMADVVALKPKAVHLMCGVNDVAGNTGPTTPWDYQNNVLAMLDLAKANRIAVILGSLTPAATFLWAPQIAEPGRFVAELNSWLAALAQARGLVFADYHAVLAEADGALRAEMTRDGIHPTAAGYRLMQPVLDRALAQTPGA